MGYVLIAQHFGFVMKRRLGGPFKRTFQGFVHADVYKFVHIRTVKYHLYPAQHVQNAKERSSQFQFQFEVDH